MEMNTTVMRSQIEKLLPTLQRREWALNREKLNKSKGKYLLEDLLRFLLEGKNALEYISGDIRKPINTGKGKLHAAEYEEK